MHLCLDINSNIPGRQSVDCNKFRAGAEVEALSDHVIEVRTHG